MNTSPPEIQSNPRPVPRPKTCSKHFRSIIRKFKNRSGLWTVRDVARGLLWRSREVLQRLGSTHPIVALNDHRAYLHPDDLRLVEDKHSLALKTGATVRCTVRARPRLTELVTSQCSARASWCRGCPRRCAVIVTFSEFCCFPLLALLM